MSCVARSIIMMSGVFAVCLCNLVYAFNAGAAVSCNPQSTYATWIGLELTSDPTSCIPESMNDNRMFDYYNVNSLECDGNGEVVYYNQEMQELDATPANILYKYRNYRIFRNKEGTHFLILPKITTA
jgi:hypothetical protein